MTNKVKYNAKNAEHDDVVVTGDPHEKRPADKKDVGDIKPSLSIKEGLQEIFGNVEGLSEDFINKTEVLFEAKVSEKVNEIIAEEVKKIEESLTDVLDSYLDLFVENYLSENEIAITTGIKNEFANQVMESISDIVTTCGLSIPEEQINIAEELMAENEKLTEDYNNLFNENYELNRILIENEKKSIIHESAKDLSEATQYKLFSLMENIEAKDKDEFIEKLQIVKDSLMEKTSTTENLIEAEINNGTKEEKIDPKMEAYLRVARGSYYK